MGRPIEIKEGKNGPFLDLYPNSEYDPTEFERPCVTVDTCICRYNDDKLQIFLVERDDGKYAIPGVFVKVSDNEELDTAAARTLDSKVHISDNTFIRQLGTYGDPERDPRWRIITVAYYALVRPEDTIDTNEDNWFDVYDLDKLSFDHNEIIDDLMERLSERILFEPIAFELLSEYFTWREAQDLYELILGKSLIAPNFRRKINSQYELSTVDELKKSTKGRPAKQLEYINVRNPFE